METPSDLTRRTILRGTALGAVAVPVLAACGDDSTDTPTGSSTPTDSGTPAGTPTDGGSADALASVSDIEVGGAVFLDGIVITQPSAGEFHAFDRTCTHQQCPVTDLQDGKIHCNCHGSLYDPATGDNVGGPAPKPLSKVDIKVEGDSIVKA